MRRETLVNIVEALKAGEHPHWPEEDFPCFTREAMMGRNCITVPGFAMLIGGFSEADIPVFERAIKAIDDGELGWIGFKIVSDPVAAVKNVDNAVTKKYGKVGSADGMPLVFFCSDNEEIVASRPYSPRDFFQMTDITRGPGMHAEQFPGLTWMAVPTFDKVHLWLIGASEVAAETASLAQHVGFRVTVVDHDSTFNNKDRFPGAERVVLKGSDFKGLKKLECSPNDYVCVLTRGHMYDPEGCVWATRNHAHYVGMMGCKDKNNTVHDLVIAQGATEQDWERVKRPIGLKFGAKTPAELAIAIVAELVDVRYRQRYSEEARAKHEASLGRA